MDRRRREKLDELTLRIIFMKAAVYEGKEQINVREVPAPTLAEGELMLAIDACSICGTDLRTYRHGDKKITPPRSAGHFCRVLSRKRKWLPNGTYRSRYTGAVH